MKEKSLINDRLLSITIVIDQACCGRGRCKGGKTEVSAQTGTMEVNTLVSKAPSIVSRKPQKPPENNSSQSYHQLTVRARDWQEKLPEKKGLSQQGCQPWHMPPSEAQEAAHLLGPVFPAAERYIRPGHAFLASAPRTHNPRHPHPPSEVILLLSTQLSKI